MATLVEHINSSKSDAVKSKELVLIRNFKGPTKPLNRLARRNKSLFQTKDTGDEFKRI